MSSKPDVGSRSVVCRDGRTVTLREARGEDAQHMLDYLAYVGGESDFLTFGAGEFSMTLEQEREFLEARRLSPTGFMIVAHDEANDVIVGTLTFATGARPRVSHSGDLGVSVAQACWGAGIGRAMLEMLIDWSSRHDTVRKLNLLVRADNVRAIALYLKLGFEVEGTLRRVLYHEGRYYDDYAMGRWVDQAGALTTRTK